MDNRKLTTKQLAILRYLFRFRFLKSIQLQKLLNDKTLRLTNYYLKILVSQNYIGKHYSHLLGQGNLPAVYFLAAGSIKVLQDSGAITKGGLKYVYREKIRSPKFISRVTFIADYYLFLITELSKTKDVIHFLTKNDLVAYPYIIQPLPDAYFAIVHHKGETKRYFFEVIDEGTPRFALRKKIEQYNDYIEEGKFELVTKYPFPTILFICSTVAILIYLKKHIERIYEETSLDQTSVYLATRELAISGQWEKAEAKDD